MSIQATIFDGADTQASDATLLLEHGEVRAASLEQSLLVAGVSASLIFAVLAFGSTDAWAISTLETGSALLFLFWMCWQISTGQLQFRLDPVYLPVVLFGLVLVAQVLFGFSAYAHITRVELWKYAAYGSLFLLVNQLAEVAAHRLLAILGVFGLMVAFFALIQYLTYGGKIYWTWPALPSSFGPYVDHSHYAGLMEMLTPIPFAMALTRGVRKHQQILWVAGGVLMAATIFLSASRGGMVAFAVEVVFFAGLLLTRRTWRSAWPVLAICLAIGAFVFWIDDGRVLHQLDTLRDPVTNSAVISRFDIARDIPRMVRERPIAGWGLGLFPTVYPEYRTFSTDLVVNQAHNDYLQALVETGILGFICVVWFIASLYRSGIQNFRTGSRLATTSALASMVGCTGILVHSFSDFNLHIPANAAVFYVLCGVATARQDSKFAG